MQVRIEEVSPVEKKLIVEVPWSTVDKKLNLAYRELSRNVQLRGFRKGKVPRSVLQRMYGKHVRAEVTSQLVRESFITATSEHNLEAVAEPRMENAPDIKKGQPLSFEAIVEVKGEVLAKNYSGMELSHPPVAVKEEEVDGALEALRRENAELLPIEGRDVTARTDHVTLKITGTIGDQTIDRPQLQVDLTEPTNEPLPGLVDALIGLPLDVEDHELKLTIPEDFRDNELAGKTANITISITDARKKQMPELDDDFAIDIDGGQTLEELREKLRGDLRARREEQIKQSLRSSALSELIKRNEIPVAPALVERGVEFQYQRLQAMLGVDPREAGSVLPDNIRENLRPAALEEVRGELLLESVAQQENIEVDSDRLDERIAELARARDVPTAKMRADLDREGQLDHIKSQLRRDATLDMLVERANLTEAEPSDESTATDEALPLSDDSHSALIDSEVDSEMSVLVDEARGDGDEASNDGTDNDAADSDRAGDNDETDSNPNE